MKTVLFLHDFSESGSCTLAETIKQLFAGKVNIIAPDLPYHPNEAIEFIHRTCDKQKIDIIVGIGYGSFLAQIICPILGVPALLGNPNFEISNSLSNIVGECRYLSERVDGVRKFMINDELISEFKELERIQFDYKRPFYRDKIWGLFSEDDTVCSFRNMFLTHYTNVFSFPGAHTPNKEEVKTWYVPIIEKMLLKYEKPEYRFFTHYKGGKYKFLRCALDSETCKRLVIYQDLNGEMDYWASDEKKFFGKVTKDGKTFLRFLEVEE